MIPEQSSNTYLPQIKDNDFQRLLDFFYKNTGICIPEEKRIITEKRIKAAMQSSGFSDFSRFFLKLKTDRNGREMEYLINELTINETYFFREKDQILDLIEHILPQIIENQKGHKKGRIRILSLPCSTGEEPYSIAILINEYFKKINEVTVEIIGGDIDTSALHNARKAQFSQRSISRIPDELKQRYFSLSKSNHFILDASIRDTVLFSKINILDFSDVQRFCPVDVIFCRNLLIYFDDASRKEALANLHNTLSKGGYIFLGHSESMSRISSLFKPNRIGKKLYFGK